MNTMPAWLLPTDTALTFSMDTSAGRISLDESRVTLELVRPWQGPDPLSAFSSWLDDTSATGIRLDTDTGTVSWAADAAIPLVSAHRAHLVAWWLTQVSAGVDQWAAFGSMASVWSSVRIPAMDAVAFKPEVGLVGWKNAGPHTAIIFLRPLHAATPMPLLRLVIDGADAAPTDRLACRFSPSMQPDDALDRAFGFNTEHRRSFIPPEGTGPADVARGVQRVEWLAENAAALDALREDPPAATTPEAEAETPFESIGAGSEGAPEPAKTAEPTVQSPAVATVLPRNTTASDESISEPETTEDSSDKSPMPGLQFERPRMDVPVPEEAPTLPPAESKALYDLYLQQPASNQSRTIELLARGLKISEQEAAAACEAAPVKIAGRIAAWEVRKLDAVIRLGGGGTLRWLEVEPG